MKNCFILKEITFSYIDLFKDKIKIANIDIEATSSFICRC